MSLIALYLIVYGVVAITHIVVQMILGDMEHVREKKRPDGVATPSVTVVVPAYNEDPALLHRCLTSIDRQDYPGIEIVVVDDGSRNVEQLIPVHDDFGNGRFRLVLRPENSGKRACQAVVFEGLTSDVVITIDSDTVLAPDAVRTIVRRFEDPKVGAVTGNVEVINKNQNLLTRLIAYRYWTAFNQERAAQSYFGVVMCASGPFSAYRRTIIDSVRDAYVNQTFLGRTCTFGDDRHLTNLVLSLGHDVVYDAAAVARTHVPARIGAYLRQQVRWNKSFYREILWTARFARRRHPYMSIDLVLQTIMPFALIGALAITVHEALTDPLRAWRYAAVVAAIGFVRSLYGMLRTRSAGFMLFMLYGFVHVLLLLPVRFYALATMRKGHWGTRGRSQPDRDADAERRAIVDARSAGGRQRATDSWASNIRAAIEQGDGFSLYWQPVCPIGGGAVRHAEILLRLRHEGQTIPPDGFLSIAEEHGLMTDVDRRVLRETIALLRESDPAQALRLEVNISADSMRAAGFINDLGASLSAARVSPRNLVISIPAAVALAEPEAAALFGRRVRALGCLFALDHCDEIGSMSERRSLLSMLPLDYVKIGRDLVRGLPHDADAQERLGQLAAETRAAGVETIAVFVADGETLELLKRAQIDFAQGFYVGSPAPVTTSLQEIAEAAQDLQQELMPVAV